MTETNQPQGAESLITFPIDFPIKIMGLNHVDFEPEVIETVRVHAPDLDIGLVEARQSSGGKYLSLTVTVRAQSRAQLDAIYLSLTAHPMVKVVL